MAGTQVRTRRDYADDVCEKAREITAPGRKRGIIPLSACRILCRYRHGIRLLLLTGCRKNEIVRLRKQEVAENCLRLLDSKTGPRTVFLNAEARAIIERRMASDGEFLFPSPKIPGHPLCDNLALWFAARKEAGIEDVRIHDLRHTFASHAVMQGTPLPVVARLLGHSRTTMTMRYAHTGDRETEAAAERIGEVISVMLEIS